MFSIIAKLLRGLDGRVISNSIDLLKGRALYKDIIGEQR